MPKISKDLLKLPKNPTECIDNSKNICSNKEVINKMVEFYQSITKNNNNVNIKNILAGLYKNLGCSSESCVILNKKFADFVRNNNMLMKNLKENFMPEVPSHK